MCGRFQLSVKGKHIKERFNVNIGYSDHTLGIEIPIAAVAIGATVI